MANTNLGIAKTHLLSRKKQTVIAILGVTFGIAMFILMISFMKGTNGFIEEALLSSTPDVHLFNDNNTGQTRAIADEYYGADPKRLVILQHARPKAVRQGLTNAEQILTSLRKDPSVVVAAPVLSAQVFFSYGNSQLNGFVDGVHIMEHGRLFDLQRKMVSGSILDLKTFPNGIILGKGLAAKLNVRTGDWVTIFSPMARSMRFRVVGSFQFGVGIVDNVKAFVNLRSLQQLMGKEPSYITDIHIKLTDLDAAKERAILFSRQYGYKAEDWATANASVMATNIVRDVLTWVVSLALLIVAGFGIYNIMNMTIASKMKDIAILKAQGFTGRDIVAIFLAQCLFIGIIGALAGIVLGFGLSYLISQMPFPQSDLITLKYYPVLFEVRFYVLGMLFGMLTTVLAGWLPALKASKLDPVAILRG